MHSLKGIFGSPRPIHRRNFIQENVRHLKEMQNCWQIHEEHLNGMRPTKSSKSQGSKNGIRQKSTASWKRLNRLAQPKTIYTSHSGYEQFPEPARTLPKPSGRSNKTRGVVSQTKHSHQASQKKAMTSPDVAAYVRQQREQVLHGTPSTDETLDDRSTVASRPTTNRAVQTVEPEQLEQLYREGLVRYPSSQKTHLIQRTQLRTPASQSASGDSVGLPDLQNLSISSPSRSKEVVETQCQEGIKNTRLSSTRQKLVTPHGADPLKPPPTYQRGVVPKYLRERKELLNKDAEHKREELLDPTCPPGHIPLPENERKETLRMLRKNYGDMVQQLNMLPVRTDTLRVRQKKMDLEKQLTKLEEGIKVFSRPKVYVKIAA